MIEARVLLRQLKSLSAPSYYSALTGAKFSFLAAVLFFIRFSLGNIKACTGR